MSTFIDTTLTEPITTGLTSIAEQVLSSTGATGVAVLAREGSGFVCRAAVGVMVQEIGARVDEGSGITGHCVRSQEPVFCDDADVDSRVNASACRQLDVRSIIAAPLFDGDEIVGVLEAFSNAPNAFGTADRAAFQDLAHVSGRVIAEWFRGENVISAEVMNDSLPAKHDSELLSNPRVLRAPLRKTIAKAGVALVSLLAVGSIKPRAIWPGLFAHAAPPEAVPVTSTVRNVASLPLVPIASSILDLAAAAPEAWTDELQRAADRGDAEAQFRLAVALASGQGVPVDKIKAYAWYIAAGISGYQPSKEAIRGLTPSLTQLELGQVRFFVGHMFLQGIGMPRDYVSAYCWFVLADAAGEPRAKSELAKLEPRMPPENVSEATSRASEWLARHDPSR